MKNWQQHWSSQYIEYKTDSAFEIFIKEALFLYFVHVRQRNIGISFYRSDSVWTSAQ